MFLEMIKFKKTYQKIPNIRQKFYFIVVVVSTKFAGLVRNWGWKESLEVIWSNPSAQAGPHRLSCPGRSRISPRMEVLQLVWVACASAWSRSQWKECFLVFRMCVFQFRMCVHCFLSCHGTSLKTAWSPLFHFLTSHVPWAFSPPG